MEHLVRAGEVKEHSVCQPMQLGGKAELLDVALLHRYKTLQSMRPELPLRLLLGFFYNLLMSLGLSFKILNIFYNPAYYASHCRSIS